MKKIKMFVTVIFCVVVSSAFAAINPCQFFHSNAEQNKYFVGDNGTLSQLGSFLLSVVPNSQNPNETSFSGYLQYYNSQFGGNANGACISNGDGTANVHMSIDNNLGSFNGVLVMTTLGPILHITSTSLLNNTGGYSNVSGYLSFGPWPNDAGKKTK